LGDQMIRISRDILELMLDEAYYLGANEFKQELVTGFDRAFNDGVGISKAAVISSIAIADPKQCLERTK